MKKPKWHIYVGVTLAAGIISVFGALKPVLALVLTFVGLALILRGARGYESASSCCRRS